MGKAIIFIAILAIALYTIFSSPKKEPVDEEHMLSGHQQQMKKAENLENVLENSATDRLEKADTSE